MVGGGWSKGNLAIPLWHSDVLPCTIAAPWSQKIVCGLGNSGVSNSMLHAQMVAVRAASVTGGSGDLDLSLALADGSMHGKADPAFAAHQTPVTRWAEAAWESWMPRAALAMLVRFAVLTLEGRTSPWSMVRGRPGCAFVATI